MSESILADSAAANERYVNDVRALDHAYLASFRPMLTKSIADVTLADIEAAHKPFNDLVKKIFDRELGADA